MDSDVIAAIAALVVAFVAFLVASAQAVQQYLVSGQLIRLCDSVVYNQMPGQGHRIWQFSQFRFRVVYSIPQIHLLPDLWLDISSHVRPLPPDAAPLPNLKVQKSKSTSAALAGEASWVSFVRAVQHSAGRSMRYVMVDGDADRCPSDLPVVPMQLSMRDITVMALSAGMQCTDASFQSQSISIQGDAGTITCSRHPVLGSLIHFAQKRALEDHGIQVLGGTIQGNWVARMLDIVTVAGHRYDSVDRKHYEEDEGSWIKASDNRPLLLDHKPASPLVKPPASTVRRRRPTHNTTAELDHGDPVTANYDQKSSAIPLQSAEKGDPLISHRPQDGKWEFISGPVDPVAENNVVLLPPHSARTPRHESPVQSRYTLKTMQYQFRRARQKPPRDAESILPIAEPVNSPENDGNQDSQHAVTYCTPVAYELKSDSLPSHSHIGPHPVAHHGKLEKTQQGQRVTFRLENGDKQGISEDPNRENSNIQPVEPRNLLLLTDGTTNTGQTSALPEGFVSPKWDQEVLQDQARHEFVVDKWQRTFQQRRKERSRGRSQNDRDKRPAFRRRPARSSREQASLDIAQEPKLRSSARHGKLAIEARRRTSSSKRLSHENPNVVFGDRQSAQNHKKSFLEPGEDKLIQDHKRRKTKSRRDTSGSSISSSTSPTLGSWGSIYGRPPFRKHRAPVERGRRRYSELYTSPADERTPYQVDFGLQPYSSGQAIPTHDIHHIANTSTERGRKRVRLLDPPAGGNRSELCEASPFSPAQGVQPCRPALRAPTVQFPEDPDFIHPGVFNTSVGYIPEGARWTKIRRDLIDPEILNHRRERYEQIDDHIIVFRVLTRDEVQQYAEATQDLRAQQRMPFSYVDEDIQSYDAGDEHSSEDSDDSHVSFVRRRDMEAERSGSLIGDLERKTTQSKDHKFPRNKDTTGIPESSSQSGDVHRDPEKHTVESAKDLDQQYSFSAVEPDDMETGWHRTSKLRQASRQHTKQLISDKCSGRIPSSVSTARQRPISRHQSYGIEGILTYAEEIMFLQSDHILKRLTACTERCKDVIITLQFVRSSQPELGPNVLDMYEMIEATKTSVKSPMPYKQTLIFST